MLFRAVRALAKVLLWLFGLDQCTQPTTGSASAATSTPQDGQSQSQQVQQQPIQQGRQTAQQKPSPGVAGVADSAPDSPVQQPAPAVALPPALPPKLAAGSATTAAAPPDGTPTGPMLATAPAVLLPFGSLPPFRGLRPAVRGAGAALAGGASTLEAQAGQEGATNASDDEEGVSASDDEEGVSFKKIYAIGSIPPPAATKHQVNLINELVLNGVQRKFATQVVMKYGENREAAWLEVFAACDAGTCPPTSENVGDGLTGPDWSKKLWGQPSGDGSGLDQEEAGGSGGSAEEEEEWEGQGDSVAVPPSAEAEEVVMVLQIRNSQLRRRFQEYARQQAGGTKVKRLFHGTHVDCAEAIALEGFKVERSVSGSCHIWFACQSSTSDSYARVPRAKVQLPGKTTKAGIMPRLASCYAMLYSRVVVREDHFPNYYDGGVYIISQNAMALPEYIILYR